MGDEGIGEMWRREEGVGSEELEGFPCLVGVLSCK